MSNVALVICKKCKLTYAQHGADGKCFFDATSFDASEELRLAFAKDINADALERAPLEKKWGQVWDTEELKVSYKVKGFLAPFVRVTRLADDTEGTLIFQHFPRYYFYFHSET